MKSIYTLTLALAVCLLGCNKENQSGTDNSGASGSTPKATNSTASAPTPPTGGPGTTGAPPAAGSAKSSDWTTTASGLKYQVLKHGTGTTSPKATDVVKVHYHGTLLDGTVFDSSVERGEPISFPLNGVIPGWTEGLQLMKVGDKFKRSEERRVGK